MYLGYDRLERTTLEVERLVEMICMGVICWKDGVVRIRINKNIKISDILQGGDDRVAKAGKREGETKRISEVML
jgi:hypothetical protein